MERWKLEPAHDLGLPLRERLRSVRRESGLVETLARHVWWTGVRGYLALMHRVRVEGIEHLPAEGPFVLVANHSSHLDALVLASPLGARMRDHVFPIAAGDTFFQTPAAAAFAAAALNALPMWRRSAGRHALDQLRCRLAEERCVYIIFPEGTRSRDGTMGQFKAGVGMLLAGTRVAAIPCRLRGTFEALPPTRRCPRPASIRLRIGEPIAFEDVANEREGWDQVARVLKHAIAQL